ncbi:MAG: MFS transporter [Deinococcales bacterium]|nr:MFS transporter [Deinococcales bacterium]
MTTTIQGFDAEPGKTRNLLLLAVATLFSLSLWFSGSAVIPQVTEAWELVSWQQSWLTMGVQVGFVVGALVSSLLNLADRIPTRWFLAGSALMGAIFNGLIAIAVDSFEPALILRVLTGVCMAGVYPPGMKLVATWCLRDRGFGIGVLVGALTIGSGLPHLLNVIPELFTESTAVEWKSVLLIASGLALLGSAIAALFVRQGPHLTAATKFNWRFAMRGLSDPPCRLANFGYFGHMWELYAMWAWVPLMLIASYSQAGIEPILARIAGFGVVAIGSVGCLIAGWMADRLGRTQVISGSLIISGICAAVIGFSFSNPVLLTAIALIWGLTVIADSAQFSAAVTELSDPRYVGTALTVQTSLGFLLTLVSIHAVPKVQAVLGWEGAFLILVLGPAFGLWSMVALRRLPDVRRIDSGRH